MAEWSKANDSKSFNRKLFVGSNPTLSVRNGYLADLYRALLGEFRGITKVGFIKTHLLIICQKHIPEIVVVDVVVGKLCVVVDI